MVDIIKKKRDGGALTREEIEFFINGYVKGDIPDYQVSALMMAIYFRGMNDDETGYLTKAMLYSGEKLDLSEVKGFKVDKHSTGGVGDKTSLVLTPMVASCGVPVAKMSGRGLGHTGGTIDKLESFKGFTASITNEQFIHNVNTIGISLMGQTKDLAPADKLLYALRDVTATVDNMSLIASSIMSKKLAASADGIVLDVKSGSGAFMKNDEDAFELAKKMVAIGRRAGVEVMAVISDMDQPLGRAVGNAIEVREAIDTLKGNGPDDLRELCLTLGSYMLRFASVGGDADEARAMLSEAISSGRALDKLADLIEAQGGSREDVYHPENLPSASKNIDFTANMDCVVSAIRSEDIGIASLLLGGGRRSKEDTIDLSVGIYLHKKVGESVKKGEPVATIYGNDDARMEEALSRVIGAYDFTTSSVSRRELIKGIVE